MTAIVLDASAYVLAFTETTPEATALRSRIAASVCHAPHLVDAEIGSVARSKLLRRELTSDQAIDMVDGASRIIQRRHRHAPLSRLAWSLRDNVSYNDALYVALATSLGLPLLTADARLGRARLPCAVEVLSPPPAPASG